MRPLVKTHDVRHESSEDEIVLGVLDVVERDPSVTQRSVALELGIALGLANAYLKRCVRKGLIKVGQIPPRRFTYYLTPHGFSEKSRLTATYLAHSFSFFRKARGQCGDLLAAAAARGHHRLALLGTGDLAEIASLVAREHAIEIVGVIAAPPTPGCLAGELAALGGADGILVTAVVESRESFEAALAVLGVDRVYAPPLLRLRAPATTTATREASR